MSDFNLDLVYYMYLYDNFVRNKFVIVFIEKK